MRMVTKRDAQGNIIYVRETQEHPPSSIQHQGRAAWKALHEKADKGEITTEWLKDVFDPMIPRYGCSCLREWNQILKDNPLPSEPREQAAWSVRLHNLINAKLGKPEWKPVDIMS